MSLVFLPSSFPDVISFSPEATIKIHRGVVPSQFSSPKARATIRKPRNYIIIQLMCTAKLHIRATKRQQSVSGNAWGQCHSRFVSLHRLRRILRTFPPQAPSTIYQNVSLCCMSEAMFCARSITGRDVWFDGRANEVIGRSTMCR
jgi:hypothetical protein